MLQLTKRGIKREIFVCTFRSAVILVLIVMITFQSPLLAWVARSDSQELATLLEQSGDEARESAIDAEDLQTLLLSDQNWLTHALKLANQETCREYDAHCG